MRSTSPWRGAAPQSAASTPRDFRSACAPACGEERQRLLERGGLGGQLGRRMREHQRAVELEHVELDQVAAELDRRRERFERVLGSERRRASMADPQQRAFRRRRSIALPPPLRLPAWLCPSASRSRRSCSTRPRCTRRTGASGPGGAPDGARSRTAPGRVPLLAGRRAVIATSVTLAVLIWNQIHHLFGL